MLDNVPGKSMHSESADALFAPDSTHAATHAALSRSSFCLHADPADLSVIYADRAVAAQSNMVVRTTLLVLFFSVLHQSVSACDECANIQSV